MGIPFEPSVYEHAARFTGRSPWEVSRDAELLFQAHRAAWLEYRHTPVVVGIDIYNLEAEAYGAVIEAPEGSGIPAVHKPIAGSVEVLASLRPPDPLKDGRIPMALEAARRLKRELPETDVRIPVAGPFSIAFNLRGIESLCEDVGLRPAAAAAALVRLAENQEPLCRAAAESGIGVAFFESAAAPPILSPRQFHEVELPALKRVLAIAARSLGCPVPCILGGDTFPVLDDILDTGTNFVVCNVETDQAAFVDRVCRERPEVKVRINMDPGIVAGSDLGAIEREVERIVRMAAGRPNCLMGSGCLPLETPPHNVHFIRRCAARADR